MVPDLTAHASSPFDAYRSHRNKPLRVHTNGVVDGVRKRTGLKVAEVAALFHDLGKLNPNFQPKLDGALVSEYSSHAYLSAHAFHCFCRRNRESLKELWGLTADHQLFSIVALIARHHGNLPNMGRMLSDEERDRLQAFLESKPQLPVSAYLQQWLDHRPFDALEVPRGGVLDTFRRMPDRVLEAVADRLGFFLDTQFAFACLVEADKRDAGDNKWFQREEQLAWARENFATCLERALDGLKGGGALNEVRTAVRRNAVQSLRTALDEGHRTFSLTAPTGAGKTFALLSLADEIRRSRPEHAVVYGLPFLTITEQVEDVSRKVFAEDPFFVTRIDSRARDEGLETILAELEQQPDKIGDLLRRSFSRETFDAAFVVTTFVQLFETLLSNRGGALLRLPNFARSIFLLDEIQALPPRLYIFLTAYLQEFCERYDSYAVLSTATMPALALPQAQVHPTRDATRLFPRYAQPAELLDFEELYARPVFDRYEIRRLDEPGQPFSIADLAKAVGKERASCLVILNTIADTSRLYKLLCPDGPREDVVLLNTRFVLDDRRGKIAHSNDRLRRAERIVLVATQLIEAGVDVDFPVVFRDMCPLPSLIQSAGRCNRNASPESGRVWFFELRGELDEVRAELVYREAADTWMLGFSRERVRETIRERNLLPLQREYFDLVNRNLAVGDHKLWESGQRKRDNLICRINQAAFEVVGSFRLIDEEIFGEEYRYYVPAGDGDAEWGNLISLTVEAAQAAAGASGRLPYQEMKRRQTAIDTQLRLMSGRVVQVRVRRGEAAPPAETRRDGQVREVCGLRKLLLPELYYSEHTGIDTQGSLAAIL